MKSDGYVVIGSFLSPHGYKGKISVFLEIKKNIENILKEPLFVEFQQVWVPFFIEDYSISGKKFIFKLLNVDSEDKALSFKKKPIYTSKKTFQKYADNTSLTFDGFDAYDIKKGFIGKIKTLLEYPGQNVFQITNPENKEILIPYNKDFIESIDKTKKTIHFITPEGLLDLYL